MLWNRRCRDVYPNKVLQNLRAHRMNGGINDTWNGPKKYHAHHES